MRDLSNKWLAEIAASKDGSFKIDMSREILHMFERFISHIILGAKLDKTLKIRTRQNDTEPFTEKESNLSGAVEAGFNQTT